MTATLKPSVQTHPLYPLINVVWGRATKTKSIRAKHIQSILVDPEMTAKMLLQTIEGDQMLKANAMVCFGFNNEPWQQSANKLLAKYTVTDIDAMGWMICSPKPDNEIDCSIADGSKLTMFNGSPPRMFDGFSIVGQWGERQLDGSFLQFGEFGDVVCRNQKDLTDIWIVKRSLFDATYEMK